jgi:hypothetical protein
VTTAVAVTISGRSVRLERPIYRFVEKCSIAKAYMSPEGRCGRHHPEWCPDMLAGLARNAVLQNGIATVGALGRTSGMD